MEAQKRKSDAGGADPINQSNHTPAMPGLSRKTRIYRARDQRGILAAVEDGDGRCFVGYFSTVSRRYQQADLRDPDNSKNTVKNTNPKEPCWEDAQERLDLSLIHI